jgi:ABC-type uncharacterized transport system involved in gliding motility auxiliary subunit
MSKNDVKKEEKMKNEQKSKKKSSQFSFLDKRSTQYGSNMILMIIAVLGVLVLINFIAGKRLPRTDFTKNQQFTLSEQSKKILDEVDQPIKIVGFYQSSSSLKSNTEDLLKEYAAVNENISYEFVDPDRERAKAKLYNVTQYNSLVLEKGEKRELLISSAESDITSAIIRLVKDERKKVYFVTGHNEKSLSGDDQNTSYALIKEELEKQIYDVAEVSLLAEGGIPDDAAVLVLAGPQVQMSEEEQAVLRKYINERKGKVLFMLDPVLDLGEKVDAETGVGLTDLLNEFGIAYSDGLVVDRVNNYFGDASTLVVGEYATHQITQGLDNILLPVVSKVGRAESVPENWTVTELMSSSVDSWLENNKTETLADFTEGEDEVGPIPLAVVAQEVSPADAKAEENQEQEPEKARIVVIGDSDFAVDPFVNPAVGVYNAELFVNTINWLAADEDLISILPKDVQPAQVTLTGNQARWILYATVGIMPLIVAIVGTSLILKRKRKRKR